MKRSSVVISALFILFFLLRAVYLSADPPVNLSGSSGYFVDEGGWVYNARNKVLFGTWELDKYNKMYLSPLNNYLYFLSFSLFGPGFRQARSVSLLFSYLILIIFYLTIKENTDRKTALISVSLLGFNYLFLMYNRIAHPRMAMLFFFVLTVYLLQKSLKGKKMYFFFGGICSCLAFIFQASAVYFFPALFCALFFIYLLKKGIENGKDFLKSISLLFGGILLVWLVFFIFNYLPHRENISIFQSVIMERQNPHSFQELLQNIRRQPSSRYFSSMRIIWYIALIYIIFLFYNMWKKPERVKPLEIFAMWWAIGGLAFFSIVNNPALRWYISIIPPLCMLAGSALKRLGFGRERGFPTLFFSVISLFLILGSIATNLHRYWDWAKSPQYKMRTISKDLGQAFPQAVITGLWAPGICLENRHKAYLSWYELFNERKSFFEEYKITHVFCVTFNKEDRYYRENFPRFMEKAKHLARYRIWRTDAHLYEVVTQPQHIGDDRGVTEQPILEAELLNRNTGMVRFDSQASNRFAVLAEVVRDKEGHLVFGPYKEYPEGSYRATFRLKTNNSALPGRFLTLDVCTEHGKRIISARDIYGRDFVSEGSYQDFPVSFTLERSSQLEFRVYFARVSDIWVDYIKVEEE